MPNFFPCPNPACTYQFDADQLPAAAMVTCPICRTRFPYRAAVAAPANDFQAPEQEENPFGSSAPPSDRPPRVNRLVTPRNAPRSKSVTAAFMAIGAALAVCGILVAIMYVLRSGNDKQDNKKDETKVYEQLNFKFRKFEDHWADDASVKNAMKVSGIVMRRKDPDAWVVVHVHDYKTRNPRPDELRKEFLEMLRSAMPNREVGQLEKVTIGDAPAEGFEFTGTYAQLEVYGQAYLFSNKGFGYSIMLFSTTWDKAKEELEKFRSSFAFADGRQKWTESEPDATQFYEKDMPYQLSDTDNIWIKARILGENEKSKGREFAGTLEWLRAQDPKATMYLRTRIGKDPKKIREMPDSFCLVVELEKAGANPLETARSYIKAAIEKDEGEGAKVTFEPAKPVSGAAMPSGELQVGLYAMTTDRDNKKKLRYAVSAMPQGGKLIVAYAWCREEVADFLESYMLKLVATLQERR